MLARQKGFTLIEMLVVIVLLGTVAAIAIPRALKTSPRQQVDRAARQLTRDLEQARMRAISAKRKVRMSFDGVNSFYTAFMDVTDQRTGTINETEEEVRESRILVRGSYGGLPGVELPKNVVFGTGTASTGPLGNPVNDAIALTGDQIEFDARGMVTPLGSNGVVFLDYDDEDEDALAAVTISASGSFQAWRYRDGNWIR